MPIAKLPVEGDEEPHPYAVCDGIPYAYDPETGEYRQNDDTPYYKYWVESGTMHVLDKRTGKSWDTGLKAKDGWLL